MQRERVRRGYISILVFRCDEKSQWEEAMFFDDVFSSTIWSVSKQRRVEGSK